MRSIRRVLAVVGLVGLGGLASSAGANPNQLEGVAIAGQGPMMTVLSITAPPELAGAPCTILFGPDVCVGSPVGMTILAPGMNLVPVANLPVDGWYTAIGPFEPCGVKDTDNGTN